MRFPVVTFHHANRPFSKIDWCTLGSLHKVITVLNKLASNTNQGATGISYKELLGSWSTFGLLVKTLLDHVVEDTRESIALGELRSWLVNNLLQQVQDTCRGKVAIRHLLASRERKLADSKLHDAETETPDIRLNRILFTLNSFGSHIGGSSNKGISNRIDKLAGNTKVTKLNPTP
jgi:uncharacterized FAD-dependent dehydrogenase